MDEREKNIINGDEHIFPEISPKEVTGEHMIFNAPIKEDIPFFDITETEIPIVRSAEAETPIDRQVKENIQFDSTAEKDLLVKNLVDEGIYVDRQVEEDILVRNLIDENIPVGNLVEEDIPVGTLVEAEASYGKIPSPASHPVNLASNSSKQSVQYNKKSKKKKGKYMTKEEIYKNPKSRWIVLLIGFVLSAASAMLAITPLLMLFVPGWAALSGDKSLIEVAKPLNITAAIVGFVSIVLGVAGANTNKFLARLVFLLGIIAFFAGIVMLMFIVPITKFLGYN